MKAYKKYLGVRIALVLIILAFAIHSCYYDSEEYLYPAGSGTSCDSTNVTYNLFVAPTLATHCNGCHNASSPQGGVVLNNYTSLRTYVLNGRFWGAINHNSGFSPMPKNGDKLSACNRLKIKKWIDAGALQN